jgi:hypothetical protein
MVWPKVITLRGSYCIFVQWKLLYVIASVQQRESDNINQMTTITKRITYKTIISGWTHSVTLITLTE